MALPIEDRLSHLDQAIQLKPDHTEAYFERGNVYGQRGEWSQALADYDQAIRLHPGYAEAYNNRGAVYCELHRLTEAIDDFSEAMRLKPDFARAKSNLEATLAAFERVLPSSNQPEYGACYWEVLTAAGRQGYADFADFHAAIARGEITLETQGREMRRNLVRLQVPFPPFPKARGRAGEVVPQGQSAVCPSHLDLHNARGCPRRTTRRHRVALPWGHSLLVGQSRRWRVALGLCSYLGVLVPSP
jgi:tetratricopeptide (TPR) repeat protein